MIKKGAKKGFSDTNIYVSNEVVPEPQTIMLKSGLYKSLVCWYHIKASNPFSNQ